jgi:hypothetical protein
MASRRRRCLFARTERDPDERDGDVAFKDGLDFVVNGEAGVVRLTPASRIPRATLDELYPAREPFVLIAAEDDEFHRRQAAATYSHRPRDWRGFVPRLAAVELPRTLQRLAASQPLTVCITGDSIAERCVGSACSRGRRCRWSSSD